MVTATQIQHNALGRLTSWSGQIHGPESWSYDGNGNIIANSEFISDAIRTTAFTYDATLPNQLDQQHTAGLGVEAYTYDQHGDTTSLVSTDPAFYANGQVDPYHVNIHVGYDAQERPLTVTTLMNGTPITATLGYNAAGQRARYTVMSGTATLRDERFSYRSDALGQDVVVSGTQTYTDTFIYDQDGLPLELVRQQNGTTSRYWYVLDGRNNVVALVDSSGNVVDRYAYDLWGEGLPEGTSETVRQPLRYGGYWWDQEVGWYWVSIRYYDPEGHWLQPDPTERDGVHMYVYVGDDPIDVSDPTGQGAIPATTLCQDDREIYNSPLCQNVRRTWRGSGSAASHAVYMFLIGDDLGELGNGNYDLAHIGLKGLALVDLASNVTLIFPVVGEGTRAGTKLAFYAAKGLLAHGAEDAAEHQAVHILDQSLKTFAKGARAACRCFPAGRR